MNATSRRGQKPWTAAKPKPVAAIRSAAASSAGRRLTRCAEIPRASVNRAEPRRAAVAIAPTANASKPRSERWTGSKIGDITISKGAQRLARIIRRWSAAGLISKAELPAWAGYDAFPTFTRSSAARNPLASRWGSSLEVHEEQAWLVVEHVIMNRRHRMRRRPACRPHLA